jgi:hypothetical protein
LAELATADQTDREQILHLFEHTVLLALYLQHLSAQTSRRKELHRAKLREAVTEGADQFPDSVHPFRGMSSEKCSFQLLTLLVGVLLVAVVLPSFMLSGRNCQAFEQAVNDRY